MKITYMNQQEYFAWTDQHRVGELLDFMKVAIDAIELGKRQEVPPGTLGYDAEHDELFVLREEK